MKKNIYLGALLLLSLSAKAQFNFGVATSNWGGTNTLYLNPANIADSREKFIIDIIGVNAGVDNSLGSLNTQGGLFGAINNGNTNNIFNYSGKSTFSMQAPYAEVRLPGFMIALNDKNSLALTMRVRGMNQFNNFDQSLFHTIADPNYSTNGDVDLTSKNFDYTAHLWSEIGVTYGVMLLDEGNSKLKAGVTARYLGGIGYVGLKGNNLDAHFKSGNDSFYASNSDLEYASNVLSTNSVINNGFSNNSVFSQFFGTKTGTGWGGDLGLEYEFYTDEHSSMIAHAMNKYLWRFSASVLDMGGINYNSSNNAHANVTGNGYVTGQGIIDNVRSFDDFKNYLVKQGFNADTMHQSTRVYMPTRLVLSADYDVYKNYYVNVSYVANLANRQNFGNSFYNQLTVTPRFDTRFMSVGLPITYNMLTNNMRMGLGVRVTGFFIGSDDMMALFAKNQYGFNFYAGGYVPFNKHKFRQEDFDTTGSAPEPDWDHGGTADTTDNCPDLTAATYRATVPVMRGTAVRNGFTGTDQPENKNAGRKEEITRNSAWIK